MLSSQLFPIKMIFQRFIALADKNSALFTTGWIIFSGPICNLMHFLNPKACTVSHLVTPILWPHADRPPAKADPAEKLSSLIKFC